MNGGDDCFIVIMGQFSELIYNDIGSQRVKS